MSLINRHFISFLFPFPYHLKLLHAVTNISHINSLAAKPPDIASQGRVGGLGAKELIHYFTSKLFYLM